MHFGLRKLFLPHRELKVFCSQSLVQKMLSSKKRGKKESLRGISLLRKAPDDRQVKSLKSADVNFQKMLPKLILTFCLLFGVFAEESNINCLKRSFCLAAQNGSNEKVSKVVESYKGILKVCKANSGQPGNCQHWQYAVMQELVESYTYGLNASQGKCQEDYVCIRKQPETFEVDVINKRVRVVKAEQCWLLVLHIEYRCVLMYVQESNCIWPSRRHSCLSINIFWPFFRASHQPQPS